MRYQSRTWELNASLARELGVKEKTATKFRIIVCETANNAATTVHLIISSILLDRGTQFTRTASFWRLNHHSNERLPTATGIMIICGNTDFQVKRPILRLGGQQNSAQVRCGACRGQAPSGSQKDERSPSNSGSWPFCSLRQKVH